MKKFMTSFLMLCLTVCLTGGVQVVRVKAADFDYLIKVNRLQNCVTVYTKDANGEYTVPYKAMICSAGGTNTPLGTFQTPAKYRWKSLVGNSWGQYSTRISGPYLFHSVPYAKTEPSTMLKGLFDDLGQTRSLGCIRLTVEDAKWIYDNCPIGTTVVIYEDENPGPLGKPKMVKLGAQDNWDPTDIWAEGNPYLSQFPQITMDGSALTVQSGGSRDLLKGVKAMSSTGEDITSSIKIIGDIPRDETGYFRITYQVTDLLGKTAEKSRYVRVR